MTTGAYTRVGETWVRKPHVKAHSLGSMQFRLGWWVQHLSDENGKQRDAISFEGTASRFSASDVIEWCIENEVLCEVSDRTEDQVPKVDDSRIILFDLRNPDHDFAFKMRFG